MPEKRYASELLRWPERVSDLETKLRVAGVIAARAADGDCIGIGSGSATYLSLWAIGVRARSERLALKVITSSYETEMAAARLGLDVLRLGQAKPDWSIDGADEVDPDGRVLKGRGGALFREKMLWSVSERIVLAVESRKLVQRLGTRFPLPVEVHPDAAATVAEFLRYRGCRDATLRTGSGKDGPVITELGCFVLDASFDEIPHGLHAELKALPGVIETGLFEGYEFEIIDERAGGSDPAAGEDSR
jgi:ribose 5-phosphate isomerase A